MRIVLAIALAALLLAGCGSSSGGGRTTVVAAFYPVAYAAQQIGGTAVSVQNLTPSGAEPHDIELTPREVGDIQRADVVLYLSHGFQPAVEKALDGASGKKVDMLAGQTLHGSDPHVWLDPVRYAAIARRVGAALGKPEAANALAAKALRLDREYRAGLAHCARREFVTSHEAFGYLSERYGLKQIPITGVDPESEPSPQALARLARLVRRENIDTVFFETLVSPRLSETVAREAGADTAVLDPIEGLTPTAAKRGASYFTVMRQNLDALRKALQCR
jgi:zinc transport system substrate-binding protein